MPFGTPKCTVPRLRPRPHTHTHTHPPIFPSELLAAAFFAFVKLCLQNLHFASACQEGSSNNLIQSQRQVIQTKDKNKNFNIADNSRQLEISHHPPQPTSTLCFRSHPLPRILARQLPPPILHPLPQLQLLSRLYCHWALQSNRQQTLLNLLQGPPQPGQAHLQI